MRFLYRRGGPSVQSCGLPTAGRARPPVRSGRVGSVQSDGLALKRVQTVLDGLHSGTSGCAPTPCRSRRWSTSPSFRHPWPMACPLRAFPPPGPQPTRRPCCMRALLRTRRTVSPKAAQPGPPRRHTAQPSAVRQQPQPIRARTPSRARVWGLRSIARSLAACAGGDDDERGHARRRGRPLVRDLGAAAVRRAGQFNPPLSQCVVAVPPPPPPLRWRCSACAAGGAV